MTDALKIEIIHLQTTSCSIICTDSGESQVQAYMTLSEEG